MARWLFACALLGGCDTVFSVDKVDEIPIDAAPPDASGPLLDNWRATTPLPAGRDYNHAHASVVDDTLFMIGGFDASLGETAIVYRATITDGELGAWTETTPLPLARALGDVVSIQQRVYVVGGANFGGAQSSVYFADVTAGAIGSWAATTPLPLAIKAHAAVTANGYLYAIGGGDTTNARHAEVQVAPIQTNGLGAWQPTTSLPGPRAGLGAVTARGYIYAIGGDDALVQTTSTVFVAALDPATGAVGAWSTTTSLPVPRKSLVAVTDGIHIYVIGGEGGPANAEVLHSRIGDDGALGPWETNAPLLQPRYRHSAVLANGLLFVLGGATTPKSVERSSQLVP